MIRRARAGRWTTAAAAAAPAVVEEVPRDEAWETRVSQAYACGWDEGRAALAEENARGGAIEAERIERAERSLEEARVALADLHDGLADALARHAATIETSAVDIALAATEALVRPLLMNAGIVAGMCAQLVDDDGADPASVLEVSPADRACLPATLRGVRIVAMEGMPRGRCVLRGPRGMVHGDIAERLQALVDAFRDLASASPS